LPAAGHVCRFAEDTEGNLWAASLEGLWKLTANQWQQVPTPPKVQHPRVVATLPDAIAQQLLAKFAR
jgi:ligand-binding sensor domain-containing protein